MLLAPRLNVAVFTLAILLAAGCDKKVPVPDTAGVVAVGPGVAGLRTLVLGETLHYSFAAETVAMAVPDSILPMTADTAPVIQFARATRTDRGAHAPGSRIVARINSSKAWARLGLLAGTNYLWSDSTSTATRMLLVPVSGTGATWLTVTNRSYLGVSPHVFRVLRATTGVGVCETGCNPVDHCGSDSLFRAMSSDDNIAVHSVR